MYSEMMDSLSDGSAFSYRISLVRMVRHRSAARSMGMSITERAGMLSSVGSWWLGFSVAPESKILQY